jgi:hypothetical protein
MTIGGGPRGRGIPPPRPSVGRKGPRWQRLRRIVRNRHEPCCRCGQRIDLRLVWPDPNSFSVDHYPHPLSTHPHLAEDLGNLHAAHLVCNQSAGAKPPTPGLGRTSETW